MTANAKTLFLTDGKAYKNGLGHVEVVRLVAPETTFPFEGASSLLRYMADGRYVSEDGGLAAYNLIEEVPVSMVEHPRVLDDAVLFPIIRTLDYRVSQRFLVAAGSFDEAEEKVREFVESDWHSSSASELGVIQVSEEMSQIEGSQDFVPGEEVVSAKQAALDVSVESMHLQGKAAEMFELLKKIAERPQMYHFAVTDLGLEAKALVDGIQSMFQADKKALFDVKVLAQQEE